MNGIIFSALRENWKGPIIDFLNIISMNYCTYNDIHLNFKFKDQQVLKVILNRS